VLQIAFLVHAAVPGSCLSHLFSIFQQLECCHWPCLDCTKLFKEGPQGTTPVPWVSQALHLKPGKQQRCRSVSGRNGSTKLLTEGPQTQSSAWGEPGPSTEVRMTAALQQCQQQQWQHQTDHRRAPGGHSNAWNQPRPSPEVRITAESQWCQQQQWKHHTAHRNATDPISVHRMSQALHLKPGNTRDRAVSATAMAVIVAEE
jgi:hypothetical protein